MIKIGICGMGFVGSTIKNVLISKGFILDKNLFTYDKYKKSYNKYNLLQCEMIFLCLPTKYHMKKEEYDKTEIYQVCEFLNKTKYNGLVILKSTVEPTITQKISNDYNLEIVHNPEFLTTKSPIKDFTNQKQVIIGVTHKYEFDKFYILKIQQIKDFYSKYFPNASITICSSNESECMKIMENVFGACKVQIFNEFYDLTKKLKINYNKVREIMLKNGRISEYHTIVPGHDGELSFGGACFTKDINALNSFMKKNSSKCKVINATIIERNEMRCDNENLIN